jgi:hypothetical protein
MLRLAERKCASEPTHSECALSLSKGAHLRASTGSAHILALGASTGAVLSLSKGSAHMHGYGLVDASRSGCDEMTEHLGLHRIRSGRIFRVPLDAEVPARMIL